MNSRQASTIALLVGVAIQASAHAEGPSTTSADNAQPLTRAEVIADLNLWHQAGLDQFSEEAVRDALTQPYEQALAKYKALRQGPAYVAELARVQAQRGEAPVVKEAKAAQR